MTEVEITFKKEGFIGIFDNVFEDEYIAVSYTHLTLPTIYSV